MLSGYLGAAIASRWRRLSVSRGLPVVGLVAEEPQAEVRLYIRPVPVSPAWENIWRWLFIGVRGQTLGKIVLVIREMLGKKAGSSL